MATGKALRLLSVIADSGILLICIAAAQSLGPCLIA
jgi:hypothetical protein